MPLMLRVITSAALGLVAAIGNYYYLANRLRSEQFVVVTTKIGVGSKLDDRRLAPITIGGDLESLRRTAVPWGERSALAEIEISREMSPGQLLLRSDIGPPRAEPTIHPGESTVCLPSGGVSLPEYVQVGNHVGFYLKPAADGSSAMQQIGPFRIAAIGKVVDAGQPIPASELRNAVLTLTTKTKAVADALLQARGRIDSSFPWPMQPSAARPSTPATAAR